MKGDARVANAAKRKADFEAKMQKGSDKRQREEDQKGGEKRKHEEASSSGMQSDSNAGNPPASGHGGGIHNRLNPLARAMGGWT